MSRITSFLWGAITVLVVSAVAYATPATVNLSTTSAALHAKAHAADAAAGHEAEPGEDETEEADEESEEVEEEDGDEAEGHGAAVSTAAHCDVHGRAHGELVSGVAKDKDATVESAQAACDEAMASATPKEHGPDAEHGNSGEHGPDAEHGNSGEHGPDAEHGKSGEHGGGKPF